jgi:hypothetical protein
LICVYELKASVAFVTHDLAINGWEKRTNTVFYTGVVRPAVVDPFPKHECYVLVGTFTSPAVVCCGYVLIVASAVVDCAILTQTQFDLYENARVFIAVDAVIRTVHFCLFLADPFFLIFDFQPLCMMVATETFVLG